MKFKVGDKVRRKKYANEFRVTQNETEKDIIYTISKFCTCGPMFHPNGNVEVFDHKYGYFSYLFDIELVEPKKIPITETDFLDCFQRNFKDGV